MKTVAIYGSVHGWSVKLEVHDPTRVLWSEKSGIYLFAKYNPQTHYYGVVYVGQAENFKERLSNHERWGEALRLGAGHILAAVVTNAAERSSLEQALIQELDPALNVHHRPGIKVGMGGLGRGLVNQAMNAYRLPREMGRS